MFENAIKWTLEQKWPENINGLRFILEDLKKLLNRSICPLCQQKVVRVEQTEIDNINMLIKKLEDEKKKEHPELFPGTLEYKELQIKNMYARERERERFKKFKEKWMSTIKKVFRAAKTGQAIKLPILSDQEKKDWNKAMEFYLGDSEARVAFEDFEELYFEVK